MRNLFPQSPLHQWRGSSESLLFFFFFFFFLHYWPSLCVRLPLPVFSITVPFCHRQGSECPLSLWPSITRHNHLRQVLRYSNKPSPDAAEAASLLKHLWELWNDWTRCWSGAVTTVDSRLLAEQCVPQKNMFFFFFTIALIAVCGLYKPHMMYWVFAASKKKKKNVYVFSAIICALIMHTQNHRYCYIHHYGFPRDTINRKGSKLSCQRRHWGKIKDHR